MAQRKGGQVDPHNAVGERCDGLLLLDVIQVAPQPRGQHAQPLGTLAGAQRALRAVQQFSGRLCHLPHLGRRAAGIVFSLDQLRGGLRDGGEGGGVCSPIEGGAEGGQVAGEEGEHVGGSATGAFQED